MHNETLSVHAGLSREERIGVITPIDPTTAFHYIDEGDQYYPRYFNTPNQDAAAEKISQLERGEVGILFSSGMAAISTTLISLLRPGDHVVVLGSVYGGTQIFAREEFAKLGVDFTFVTTELAAIESAIRPETRLIYIESPTNPLLEIVDVRAVSEIARNNDTITVIDNTFATPINQRPIELGIDVVVHSGTKYLGGHSDLCCGAVVTSRELGQGIRKTALNLGGSLNAICCYLLERSLKTLAIRVQRQSENAQTIAEFLAAHSQIGRVYFPGLPQHPNHDIAARQMDGFGAMLAFELGVSSQDAPTAVRRFLQQLSIVVPALSLGGVESTICVPSLTSHRKMAAESRERMGLTDLTLRLSVGIENADDLISDLDQALKSLVGKSEATIG